MEEKSNFFPRGKKQTNKKEKMNKNTTLKCNNKNNHFMINKKMISEHLCLKTNEIEGKTRKKCSCLQFFRRDFLQRVLIATVTFPADI